MSIGIGWPDGEVVERRLAPAQEGVALLVALELALGVARERVAAAERVDLHGMVDHELGGDERVDHRRVAAHVGHRVAHRGEVDDGRHTGEVLHHHARGRERDLLRRLGGGVPAGQRLDVRRRDRAVALGAQQVLEQDLQRERQPRDIEAGGEGVEAEDLDRARSDLERAAGIEAVRGQAGLRRWDGRARADDPAASTRRIHECGSTRTRPVCPMPVTTR